MPQDGDPTTGTTSPDTTNSDPANLDTAGTPPADTSIPPWERRGEPFDAPRAWALIERLRAERDTARRPPANTPPQADTSPAPATPAAPAPAPDVDVEALRSELVRERVARRFGLDDDLVELLGVGDEDTITARAKTLADRLTPVAAAKGSPVPRRPVEQLRGGSDPTTGPEETDPAKLAARVRRSRF